MTAYEAFVANLSNGNKVTTAQRLINDAPLADLLHAVIGLSGEAGEVLDLTKKTLYYGRLLDRVALLEELGDALHYLTAAAVSQGWSIADVQQANMDKLCKRFPDGVFSVEKANLRLDKVLKAK